jgi:glycosyltransferase involved in cell wall biosynthesis
MLFGVNVIVVVPAYEEAPRIGRVLAAMPADVDHVIVVDDASRDATSSAARARADARVTVIRHSRNRGVGAAIASGYRRALALSSSPRDAFVVMAGDGQMDPADMPALVEKVARGEADYVKGNRFAWPGAARAMPPVRLYGGKLLSWLTAHATGLAIHDSQCGYTALARGACARLDLDGMWPSYGSPNDLLGQLALRRMRVAEAPVRPVYADEVSRLTPRHWPVIGGVVLRAALRTRRSRART